MTTEYLPANAARVQGKIDMLDVSEQAIANVDQALAWVGLKTYTQLCDQLAELAEVAIRDTGRLEQQVVELAEAKAILPNLLKYLGMMIRWADLTVVPALGEGALPRCIDRARAVLDAARAALPVPPLPAKIRPQ